MESRASRQITWIWGFLSAITVLSWALASARGGKEFSPSVPITVAVIAIAVMKARVIIRHFMGVRGAPAWLRLCTDAWLAALSVALLGLYLY
jgi:hypothetical protein